nr:hypothetical protein CFP56_00398 [Quercus suber]
MLVIACGTAQGKARHAHVVPGNTLFVTALGMRITMIEDCNYVEPCNMNLVWALAGRCSCAGRSSSGSGDGVLVLVSEAGRVLQCSTGDEHENGRRGQLTGGRQRCVRFWFRRKALWSGVGWKSLRKLTVLLGSCEVANRLMYPPPWTNGGCTAGPTGSEWQ